MVKKGGIVYELYGYLQETVSNDHHGLEKESALGCSLQLVSLRLEDYSKYSVKSSECKTLSR
jgi:hypothetical protein